MPQGPGEHPPRKKISKGFDNLDQLTGITRADSDASEGSGGSTAANEGVSLLITKDQRQQLADVGYSRELVHEMKPADAHQIISEGKTFNAPPPAPAQEPVVDTWSDLRTKLSKKGPLTDSLRNELKKAAAEITKEARTGMESLDANTDLSDEDRRKMVAANRALAGAARRLVRNTLPAASTTFDTLDSIAEIQQTRHNYDRTFGTPTSTVAADKDAAADRTARRKTRGKGAAAAFKPPAADAKLDIPAVPDGPKDTADDAVTLPAAPEPVAAAPIDIATPVDALDAPDKADSDKSARDTRREKKEPLRRAIDEMRTLVDTTDEAGDATQAKRYVTRNAKRIQTQNDDSIEEAKREIVGLQQQRIIDLARETRGDAYADQIEASLSTGLKTSQKFYMESAGRMERVLRLEKELFGKQAKHHKNKMFGEVLDDKFFDTDKRHPKEIQNLKAQWQKARAEHLGFMKARLGERFEEKAARLKDKYDLEIDGLTPFSEKGLPDSGGADRKRVLMKRYERRFGAQMIKEVYLDAEDAEANNKKEALSARKKGIFEKGFAWYQGIKPAIRVPATYALLTGGATAATIISGGAVFLVPLAIGATSAIVQTVYHRKAERETDPDKKAEYLKVAGRASVPAILGMLGSGAVRYHHALQDTEGRANATLNTEKSLTGELTAADHLKAMKQRAEAYKNIENIDRQAALAGTVTAIGGGLAIGGLAHHIGGSLGGHHDGLSTGHDANHPGSGHGHADARVQGGVHKPGWLDKLKFWEKHDHGSGQSGNSHAGDADHHKPPVPAATPKNIHQAPTAPHQAPQAPHAGPPEAAPAQPTESMEIHGAVNNSDRLLGHFAQKLGHDFPNHDAAPESVKTYLTVFKVQEGHPVLLQDLPEDHATTVFGAQEMDHKHILSAVMHEGDKVGFDAHHNIAITWADGSKPHVLVYENGSLNEDYTNLEPHMPHHHGGGGHVPGGESHPHEAAVIAKTDHPDAHPPQEQEHVRLHHADSAVHVAPDKLAHLGHASDNIPGLPTHLEQPHEAAAAITHPLAAAAPAPSFSHPAEVPHASSGPFPTAPSHPVEGTMSSAQAISELQGHHPQVEVSHTEPTAVPPSETEGTMDAATAIRQLHENAANHVLHNPLIDGVIHTDQAAGYTWQLPHSAVHYQFVYGGTHEQMMEQVRSLLKASPHEPVYLDMPTTDAFRAITHHVNSYVLGADGTPELHTDMLNPETGQPLTPPDPQVDFTARIHA